MRKIILGIILLAAQTAMAATESEPECVIMIHGMMRTQAAMVKLSSALQAQGYFVVNESYPTNRYTIQQVAQSYVPHYVDQCLEKKASKIHFVTHSIGGLVLRAYLSEHTLPTGSRVVMLAPPNHGSTLADTLHKSKIFNMMTGPMGQQLQTKGFVEELPETFPVDIGVITGSSSLNPIAATMLGGENDGKVSVGSAKLAGMKDFMVVPVSHTFIMRSPQVIEATSTFLKLGSFHKT